MMCDLHNNESYLFNHHHNDYYDYHRGQGLIIILLSNTKLYLTFNSSQHGMKPHPIFFDNEMGYGHAY